MVKIDLASRLEGIDPFGEDVTLDEGIMEGILREPPKNHCEILSISGCANRVFQLCLRVAK